MPKPVFLLLNIVSLALFSAVGQSDTAGRIANGQPYDVQRYPFFARIFYQNQHSCGASLIADKFVATAAHCLEKIIGEKGVPLELRFPINSPENNNDPNNYQRFASALDQLMVSNDGPFAYNSLNPGSLVNDFGLIEMDTIINIAPIRLPTTDTVLTPGETLTVIGFGSTGFSISSTGNGPYTKELYGATVGFRDDSDSLCEEAYPNFDTTSVICAGGFKQGENQAACSGDSGGPLMKQDGTLVGLVSFGRISDCGLFSDPTMFADVRYARPWYDRKLFELGFLRPTASLFIPISTGALVIPFQPDPERSRNQTSRRVRRRRNRRGVKMGPTRRNRTRNPRSVNRRTAETAASHANPPENDECTVGALSCLVFYSVVSLGTAVALVAGLAVLRAVRVQEGDAKVVT